MGLEKDKKKINGRTDGRQKPRHDISSAGYQPAELKMANILSRV